MFLKAKAKTKVKSAQVRPANGVPPSIISTDLKITGNLATDGEVQIDGLLEGDVKCGRLSIGATGRVLGSVFVEFALVRGKVEGQIRAKNVTLTKSASVIGDIMHETLTIEPGAHLEGHCRRVDEPQKSDSNIN